MTATPEPRRAPDEEVREEEKQEGGQPRDDAGGGEDPRTVGPAFMMGTVPTEPEQMVPGATSGGGGAGATTRGGRITGDVDSAAGPLAERPDEETDDEPGTGSNMGGRA